MVVESLDFSLIADAGELDGDNDGVGNACDNCTEVSNTSQCDTDADGYGNHYDADFDNTDYTNFDDLGIMRAAFFSNLGEPEFNPGTDMDCNNTVISDELGLLRGYFIAPPGPSAVEP